MYSTDFETFLVTHDSKAWDNLLTDFIPSIHEVDQIATQIWFKFYPFSLYLKLQSFETLEERAKFIQNAVIQGKYELKDQIDSSHHFLYAHRFWGEVKHAIIARAGSFLQNPDADLAFEISQIVKSVAPAVKVKESLVVGIVLVGFMTLRQVGLEAFSASAGTISLDKQHAKRTVDEVLTKRSKDDSQGIFGFLKTVDKQWTVTYNENDSSAQFKAFNNEEIASAAARDQSKNWVAMDPRCGEGVIPVECRSAACGTCWVGVIGGQDRLKEVSQREAERINLFGYDSTDEPKPFIRLACQAETHGAVSIVIPPWNGVFGKAIGRNVKETELEPTTTSAKQLREVMATVGADEQKVRVRNQLDLPPPSKD